MVRGPKKHLKRLNAPKHWMLAKMGGIWAPKPAAGPHKSRECLPLSIILRNRLKYALTRKEALMVVMQKLVNVDGKVRTELNFPAGFMGECLLLSADRRRNIIVSLQGAFGVLSAVNGGG
jgi:small subunit ribosomal protein S4e